MLGGCPQTSWRCHGGPARDILLWKWGGALGYSTMKALQHGRDNAPGLWPTCSMMLLSVRGIRLLLTCKSAPSQHKNLSKAPGMVKTARDTHSVCSDCSGNLPVLAVS